MPPLGLALALILLASLVALAALAFSGAWFIMHDPTRLRQVVVPENFSLPYEKVSFTNADGLRLAGWIIPAAKPTGRTIMLCHGWGAYKGHILEHTRFLRERGFDLFYFDFRCCGESEGRRGTIGYLEARDFDAALDFLKRERPEMTRRLGVYGQSMGGAVSLIGATRSPEIKALIVEGAYYSYNEVVPTYSRAKWGLPRYPLMPAILAAVRLWLGVDPEVMSPAYFVDKLRAPVLYVWGTDDDIMPLEWGRELHRRTPGEKELVIIEGGAHADLWALDPKLYEEKVGGFFEKHV